MQRIFYILILSWIAFVAKGQDTLLLQSIQMTDAEKIVQLLQSADEAENPSTVLRYLLEAQSLMEKQGQRIKMFTVYTRIGNIYKKEKLNDRALNFFKKADALPSPPLPEKSKIELYHSIADVYYQKEQPDSSLIFYNKILNYYEKTDNHEGKLSTLQKKTNVYLKSRDFQQALETNLAIKTLLKNKAIFPENIKNKTLLAISNNNIGYTFNFLENYPRAISYFQQALALRDSAVGLDIAGIYTNIGIAYNNMGDEREAINHLLKAQEAIKKNSKTISKSFLQHLIATIYLESNDPYNALRYNDLAILNSKKRKEFDILKDAYFTGAKIHQGFFDYELALDFYEKHLELRDSFRLEERLRQQELLQERFLLEKSEKEIRLLLVNQQIQDQRIARLELENENFQLNSDRIKLEAEKNEKEVELLKNQQAIKEANLRNSELEKEKAQQQLALTQQRLFAETQEKAALEAKQKEELAILEAARSEAEKHDLETQNEVLKQKEEIARLDFERQESNRKFFVGLMSSLLLLLLLAAASYWNTRKKNQKLEAQNREIEKSHDLIQQEKQKSDELLLNILPVETAQELKETGFATPRKYEKVTVLFTDFSNFTKISEKMSADELIEELNFCFRKFDEIIERYGLEKIKTIGDGYMCAGGIPKPNDTNPTDAVKAAVEMQSFMQQRVAEQQQAGNPYWNMRIGIHTGNVIAGVVGTKKFAYDIWGDTVNTASRMESNGENGKINISASTRQYLNGEFKCTYRGEMAVKNKDKVGMYFVEGK